MEAIKVGTGTAVKAFSQGEYWTWTEIGGGISVKQLRQGDRWEVGRYYSKVEAPADTSGEYPRRSGVIPSDGYWWLKHHGCAPHLRFMRAGEAVPTNAGFVGACVPAAYALLASGKKQLHEAVEGREISILFEDGEWFASLDGATGEGKTPSEAIEALCELHLLTTFPQAGSGDRSEQAILDATLADGLAD